jgi:hypothetical protein
VTEQTSRLVMRFRHPAAAFLYQATSPRVRIDGVDTHIRDWGTHTIPVPAGPHRVEVWVPYAMPRRLGRTRAEVSVAPGAEVRLEYMAPSFAFARGSLGAPGQQRSAGFRTVMAFNIVVVLAVVVGWIIYLIR